MSSDDSLENTRQQRLGAAIAEYLQAIDRNLPFQVEYWLSSYPDLRPHLEEFLRMHGRIESMTNSADSSLAGDTIRAPQARALSDQADDAAADAQKVNTAGPRDADFRKSPLIPGYELLNELGAGGMGVVYQARQLSLNRLVALKIPRGQHLTPDELRRFVREADAVARLDHQHIVPIYDVGRNEDGHRPSVTYLCMKLMTGGSLLTAGIQNPHAAATLLHSIAEAVEHAHQRGILHRDLKPSNILLDDSGQPMVADFGLAKQLDRSSHTLDETTVGTILGTPSYMSPEQLSGEATTLSDVYSLGAVLYWLLTGGPPFHAESLSDLMQKLKFEEPVSPRKKSSLVPRDLETICLKCLNKVPSRRYQSAGELAADLDAWLNNRPICARPVSSSERLLLWIRRNPGRAVLSATAISALLVAVASLSWMLHQADADRRRIDRQREVAVRNLQFSENAIDELLSAVQDELAVFPALDPIRLRMLKTALRLQVEMADNHADNQADHCAGTHPGDHEERSLTSRQSAFTRLRMAELHAAIGEFSEAERFLKLAEEVPLVDLEFGESVTASHQREQLSVRIQRLKSEIQQQQHRYSDAESSLTQIISRREQQPEIQWPLSIEFDYLTILRERAILIARRSHPESLTEFHRALNETLALQERVNSSGKPEDRIRFLELLSSARNSYAIALRANGQTDEAVQNYQQSVELMKKIEVQQPLTHLQSVSLASTLLNLGNILIQKRDFQQAAQNYQDSNTLFRKLIAENPLRIITKQRMIASLIGLAISSYRLDNTEQAVQLYSDGLSTLAEYERQHPEMTANWRADRATILVNLVNCQITLQRYQEALETSSEVIVQRKEAELRSADGGNAASELAVAFSNQAAVYKAMNQLDDEMRVRLEAISFHEKAIARNRRSTIFLERLSFDVRRILEIDLEQTSSEFGLEMIRRYRRLTESDPSLIDQLKTHVGSLLPENHEVVSMLFGD